MDRGIESTGNRVDSVGAFFAKEFAQKVCSAAFVTTVPIDRSLSLYIFYFFLHTSQPVHQDLGSEPVVCFNKTRLKKANWRCIHSGKKCLGRGRR